MENQSTPEKKLRRSSGQRMIAGVCGGLAEYFNVDPILIRLVFVVLAFMGAGGVLLYIVLWIIMPEDTSTQNTPTTPMS
jgi:phage shock protein C